MEQLARESGLPLRTLRKIEDGVLLRLSIKKVFSLCDALGIQAADLFRSLDSDG